MMRYLAGPLAVSIVLAGCGKPLPIAKPASVVPAATIVSNSTVAPQSASLQSQPVAQGTAPSKALEDGAEPEVLSPAAAAESDASPAMPPIEETSEDAASALALDDLLDFGVQSMVMKRVTIFKIFEKTLKGRKRKGSFANACEKALKTSGKKTSLEAKDLLTAGRSGKTAFLAKAKALSIGGPFSLAYDRKWRFLGLKCPIETALEHNVFYATCEKLVEKYDQ